MAHLAMSSSRRALPLLALAFLLCCSFAPAASSGGAFKIIWDNAISDRDLLRVSVVDHETELAKLESTQAEESVLDAQRSRVANVHTRLAEIESYLKDIAAKAIEAEANGASTSGAAGAGGSGSNKRALTDSDPNGKGKAPAEPELPPRKITRPEGGWFDKEGKTHRRNEQLCRDIQSDLDEAFSVIDTASAPIANLTSAIENGSTPIETSAASQAALLKALIALVAVGTSMATRFTLRGKILPISHKYGADVAKEFAAEDPLGTKGSKDQKELKRAIEAVKASKSSSAPTAKQHDKKKDARDTRRRERRDRRDDSDSPRADRSDAKCYKCGERGHMADRCRNRRKF